MNILTTKLSDGREVLAQWHKGRLHAVTYANVTQANNKVQALGAGWCVTGNRPYFVTRDHAVAPAFPIETDPAPPGKTKREATAAIAKLREFINPSQLQCLGDLCRGEEKQFFFDKLCEMAEIIEKMPQTYDTEEMEPDAKVVFLHYFKGGCDWWIIEKDKGVPGDRAQHQAFGWADLGHGAELGYISIVELLSCGAELDLHFPPKTWGELQSSDKQEPCQVEPKPPSILPVTLNTREVPHETLHIGIVHPAPSDSSVLSVPSKPEPPPWRPSWHRLRTL